MKIAILPGDGIGTEIVAEAVKVMQALDLHFELETAPVGGAAYELHGHPLPDSTLQLAKAADAILFGAVGDWKYDKLDRPLRPEQAILGLRKNLGLFANFRPAICYEQLVDASSLKGKTVWFIPLGAVIPALGVEAKGIQEAADGLGVTVKTCDGKLQPAAASSCISQATKSGADGILIDSVTPQTVTTALRAAWKATWAMRSISGRE